ncbi:PREDICTED: sodium/calcium exchanger 2-like isoform X1 [Myotis brandtii]|uniref:sodium/calcium exchanger 2-like isoform X1 n=2 Tax=Myotis brandtii TaxID=109478 RepID=UPI0007044983|nr:PREDICTED: sodium/calcium exchanger 2-like isoform X1 [Myotis brandtii]
MGCWVTMATQGWGRGAGSQGHSWKEKRGRGGAPELLLGDFRTPPPSMAPLALVGFALLLGAPPCSGAATPTPSLPPSPTNDSDTSTEVCQGSNRCQPGVLLPVWEPDDPSLGDKAARAVVYFVAMVYMFLGVSIIADRFMASIEVITSKEKEITITKANGETSVGTVRIWNETVSNLTLMALGSSAPEILLSVIEVCGHNFQAGELGPGTIVGSAAFNMFVVIAVCVYVIPAGESRKIKHLRVFFVTASWSIFAYVWLYLILAVFSPGVVQVSTARGHRLGACMSAKSRGGAPWAWGTGSGVGTNADSDPRGRPVTP